MVNRLSNPPSALGGVLVLSTVLFCSAAGAGAAPETQPPPSPGAAEEARARAEALLELSRRQNFFNHALALQSAREALGLWEAADDQVGMARAHAQVAQCYFAQSDLPEAVEHYQAALRLWRDQNNVREQAAVLLMLCYIEERKGEWSNAVSLLTQARALVDEAKEPFQMAQISAGLAYIFNENGMPEVGLVHYRRALDYYRRASDEGGANYMTLRLGATYYLMGDYGQALTNLRQALSGVAPDSLDAAACRHQLGIVHIATGEYDAALAHLQSALTIYEGASNPKEAAQVRALIGQVYEQQGRTEPARLKYRQALSVFDKLSDRVNQAAVNYALGSLELRAQDYDAAEAYLSRSIRLTENLRRRPASGDLTAYFSATVSGRYEKYIECLMRQRQARLGERLDVLAFEASESGRARSLAELLKATETEPAADLDPALAEQEMSLRQELRFKEDYRISLLSGAYRKEALHALEAEIERLEADYKRVTEAIRERCPSCVHASGHSAWGLARIQREAVADDETVLLEYSLGEDESYVWAVTRDRVNSYELPGRAHIEEAARRAYDSLSAPPGTEASDALPAALRELSRMVLAPAAADLKKRHVIVVADGALNYIPFQVLPAPAENGRPLVADSEVSNAPSASVLGELREEASRRQPATKVLAAFGNPVFAPSYALRREGAGGSQPVDVAELEEGRLVSALRDTGLSGDSFDSTVLGPLFYAKRELKELRDAASDDETFVASDFAATRERLLSADLTQYAILHFATHALLDTRRPESSGLVLSTVGPDGRPLNGFVGLRDVYSLRAPVDLVVLSACRTALGKDVRGEGLVGLARSFMYAGASGVVASLWKVEDKATAELMKQFYAGMLQEGMPPGAALREAQNRIRQDPRWRSPYYWAGFTLQGEYSRPIRHRTAAGPRLKLVALGAGLLALLAFASWWYLRRSSRGARGVV